MIKQGIVLIFIPLLHKFQSSNPTWGNIGVYHLDKLFDCNCLVYHQLLRQCSSIEGCTSTMLFIFILPQFLINHPKALSVFLTCTHNCTLLLIAMDEVHIHVQHGLLFHEEICALCIKIFRLIYGNQPRELQPRPIALTGTFPRSYLQILSSLVTVDLSILDCILRGTSLDFQQREIEMKLDICSKKAQFITKGLNMVADFLYQDQDSSVVIFCNFHKQSQHFSVQLEKKLDIAKLNVDVLNINKPLNKIDKF